MATPAEALSALTVDDLARRRAGLRTHMNTYKQYIGGEWVDASSGGTWDVVNPATEEVVQTVTFWPRGRLQSAIDAARSLERLEPGHRLQTGSGPGEGGGAHPPPTWTRWRSPPSSRAASPLVARGG